MNRLLFTLPLLIFAMQANAQIPDSTFIEPYARIVVHKDPRLDLLVSKQIEINEITTRNSRRFAKGYRLLVISSRNRNEVVEAKTKIYRHFPGLKAYMMYKSPFFRLKVGNFRDRVEAEGWLTDVQKLFEGSVYVVPDTIQVHPGPVDQ